MKELFDIAISTVNLPLTILFGLLIIYWILTTLTGLDLDFFDADIDVDVDADVDVDLDSDFDARGNLDVQDISNPGFGNLPFERKTFRSAHNLHHCRGQRHD